MKRLLMIGIFCVAVISLSYGQRRSIGSRVYLYTVTDTMYVVKADNIGFAGVSVPAGESDSCDISGDVFTLTDGHITNGIVLAPGNTINLSGDGLPINYLKIGVQTDGDRVWVVLKPVQ